MIITDPKIENYCTQKSTQPSAESLAIETYTKENIHGSKMLIGRLEASFLGFLIRSIAAKNILELGTFTGYSALTMAENLPEYGQVITLDINNKTVEIAKEFWKKSIHGNKITSIIGPALDTLSLLKIENKKFDLIFIDADKRNYKEYLILSLSLLNSNGIIVIDNVLWGGEVISDYPVNINNQTEEHRNTAFIKELNDYIASDDRLYSTLLPIRDGIFLITLK